MGDGKGGRWDEWVSGGAGERGGSEPAASFGIQGTNSVFAEVFAFPSGGYELFPRGGVAAGWLMADTRSGKIYDCGWIAFGESPTVFGP